MLTRRIASLLPLTMASMVHANTVLEMGDAPDLPPGQDLVGVVPTAGSIEIMGSHFASADVDLYRINIVDPQSFSAKTFGADALDTQVFLFTEAGFAVAGNDDRFFMDDLCATFQDCWSDLSGVPGLQQGIHFLAVTQYPFVPFSVTGSIFTLSFAEEVIVPFVGLASPTGAGGAAPLASWQNPFGFTDPLFSNYTMEVTGVPEPSMVACAAVALLSVGVLATGVRPKRGRI